MKSVSVLIIVISGVFLHADTRKEIELSVKLDATTKALANERQVRLRVQELLADAVTQKTAINNSLSKQTAVALASESTLEKTQKSLEDARKQLAAATEASRHNTQLLNSIEAFVTSQTLILIIGIASLMVLMMLGFYFLVRSLTIRQSEEAEERIKHLRQDLIIAQEGRRVATEVVSTLVAHKDEKNGT